MAALSPPRELRGTLVAASTREWQKWHYVNPETSHKNITHFSGSLGKPVLDPSCQAVKKPRWASTERRPRGHKCGCSNQQPGWGSADSRHQSLDPWRCPQMFPASWPMCKTQASNLSAKPQAVQQRKAVPTELHPDSWPTACVSIRKWLLYTATFWGEFLRSNSHLERLDLLESIILA